MARRRPWPVNANEHRIAAAAHFRAVDEIAEDLEGLREVDRHTLMLALAKIRMHTAQGERHLVLAKFGEPDEEV